VRSLHVRHRRPCSALRFVIQSTASGGASRCPCLHQRRHTPSKPPREASLLVTRWFTAPICRVGFRSGLSAPRKAGRRPTLQPPPQIPKSKASTAYEVVYFLSASVVYFYSALDIADPHKALREMRRVLKASGTLIFVEHGRAPDPGVVVWQDRLTPVWKRIGGGCHLNRKIDEIIKTAGFQIPKLTTSYIPGPRPMTYTYQGIAQTIR